MKFHMLMHLPSWTNNHVTCWALERHHKVVKRFLNNLPNTSLHYDTTILRDSTCFHLGVLKSLKADDFFQVGLLQGAPPSPQMEGAWAKSLARELASKLQDKPAATSTR